MSQPSELEALIAYCQGKGICPMPDPWNRMFNILADGMDRRSDVQLPLPLILAAWSGTGWWHKQDRFLTHLHLAAEHGKLAAIDKYLRALPDESWFRGKN